MATVKKIKKAQTGGSLGSVWTGPMNEDPGVVKAKADKAKADANLNKYKKKSDVQKATAIEKAKASKTGVKKPSMKSGGSVSKAEGGKWIQKAINPKHKGFCTPMTKKTCTPKRKALAITLKKMAKSRKGK